jgi:hypothetical protein
MARKTPEERARIKAETMARRDPNKDLTRHEAARGIGLSSLSELKRLQFDLRQEDYERFYKELNEQSDRGAALVATAFIEHILVMVLCTRMAAVEGGVNSWFYGDKAPFSSFSAKIKIARALGILGPQTEEYLDRLRNIRNLFAHTPRPADFSTPAVAAECRKLLIADPDFQPSLSEGRRNFTLTVYQLVSALCGVYDASVNNPVPVLLK